MNFGEWDKPDINQLDVVINILQFMSGDTHISFDGVLWSRDQIVRQSVQKKQGDIPRN